MFAIPNLSTRHRVVKLDILARGWVRAPGEAPGIAIRAQGSSARRLADRLRRRPRRYPAFARPSNATVRAQPDGAYVVRTAAVDIGTGARTTLTVIAADTLKTRLDRITM